MHLEAVDGVALLGYAGLGMTERGTEPSDWMSAVLRGRKLPIDKSIGLLAAAMQRELPRHLGTMIPTHGMVAPAFVDDIPTLYTVEFAPSAGMLQWGRSVVASKDGALTRQPPIGIGGSGAVQLSRDRSWMRPLRRLVKAHDRGALSATVIADYLAALNDQAYRATPDGSVGPRCIVSWCFRKGSRRGGSFAHYTNAIRDRDSLILPTIGNGIDVKALAEVVMSINLPILEARLRGEKRELDKDTMNAKLALLPDKPDEELR